MTSKNQKLISVYKKDAIKLDKLKLTKHDTYAEIINRLLEDAK